MKPNLKKGDPVIFSRDNLTYYVGYYRTYCESKDINGIYTNWFMNSIDIETPIIVIPFDKFNPNNIDESLKYNIQK